MEEAEGSRTMEEAMGSRMMEHAKKLIGFYNAMWEQQTTPEKRRTEAGSRTEEAGPKTDEAEVLTGETWGIGIRTGMKKLGGRCNPVWFKQATNGNERTADPAKTEEEVEDTDDAEEQTEKARRAEIRAGKGKAV